MVRGIKRHEAFWVLRRCENSSSVFDADSLISGRMHDKQRLTKLGDVTRERLALGILDQLPADGEGATTECNVGNAITFNISEMRLKLMQHMRDIRRRADRYDCRCLRYTVRCSQHRSATQRVTYENCRGPIVRAQVIGGEDEILDIRGEIGVRELPLGGSEPCEIKPQNRNTKRG